MVAEIILSMLVGLIVILAKEKMKANLEKIKGKGASH